MLLTKNTSAFSLYDDDNVNRILVHDILSKYEEAFSFFDSRPQDE